MLVEKIYILGALLKLPFFTHDGEMKNWANSYLTFHSWSPEIICVNKMCTFLYPIFHGEWVLSMLFELVTQTSHTNKVC